MAKRFTDTELWDKVWFMELDCKLKCLVKMVRDKADLCGVWSPNWAIASMYIGEKVTEKDLLKIDGGNQFKKLDNGKIFCIGFVEFQYGELSEKSPVHRKILTLLTQNDLLETYYKIPYQYPINTPQEEEEDKEEDKEMDKEEEKEGAKILNPFGQNFQAWEGWKQYKREEHREGYRSPKTEVAALHKLFELARGNPETAEQIIQQSIANRWKGLFEIKNNGSSKKTTGFSRQGVQSALDKRLSEIQQNGG